MSDTLQHLQKLKSRLSLTQAKAQEMTAVEKVEKLEQVLSVFRTEVDMKLKIMQQILTTRNEQVTVQKKLLDKEQSLYNTLLGHWMNTPQLAATGLSVNFSADDVNRNKNEKATEAGVTDDVQFVENESDPDYSEGDDIGSSPRRPKKSRSSLRRQRQSARTTRNSNVKKEETVTVDPYPESPSNEWTGRNDQRDPPVEVEIGTTGGNEGAEDDFNELLGHLNEGHGHDDDDEDQEDDNGTPSSQNTSMFHGLAEKNTNDVTIASVPTRDGRNLEVKLPQTLIYQLHSVKKERSIVSQILKYYYSIPYLRNCTLTGASNKAKTKKQKALPPDMVILIQEAVKKFLPPTKSPNSDEGQKLIADQGMRTRGNITKVLQYYKESYNEDGSNNDALKLSRSKRKRSRTQAQDEDEDSD